MIWFAICGVGALADAERRPVYKRAARTVAGVYAINQALKFAVRRHRPRLWDLPPLAATLSGLSHPSAHPATSFAAPRLLSPALPVARRYAVAIALALSTPYLGLLWPSDIVAGAAIGAALAELRS